MASAEEIQTILEVAAMWREFKKTVWYESMRSYIMDQVDKVRDDLMEHTVAGKYEEAKALAHRVSGLREVLDMIEEKISMAEDALSEKKAQADYDSRIPKHVQ
jgi:hypothetical protein